MLPIGNNRQLHGAAGVLNDPTHSLDDYKSDRCVSCLKNQRGQVTLPCAHFLLCGPCGQQAVDCPKCGHRIVGQVKVFIA
ncbi:hypothetical protein BOX15_Mlig024702g1 [Macrostomum lignano]|uniref:RING-type domain-containing protein n=1 Tax=Macrostomum lignano TaxID=282301 RepID=A0A267GG72_9PLAT|nr:hypothetical protein BOX15_Mlig011579g1 [Macrostomum lignano]PAA85038.1 hypothetical protein BOX15_Mlig024702g1 [Macrostomum lignano]